MCDVRAAKIHRHRCCVALLPPQSALAGDPVVAAIARDLLHRVRAFEHRRPRRSRPASVGFVAPDPGRGRHPQRAAIGSQRVHHRLRFGPGQRHARRIVADDAAQALVGRHPQGAGSIERQPQDGVGRQSVLRRPAGDAAAGLHPVHAGIVGAEPQVVAAAGDGPGVVAADLRVVGLAVEVQFAVRCIQHRNAAAFDREPDAVAMIDMQRLDVVPRQALGVARIVAPDPHADAVEAGEAVGGRDPQIALLVQRQRLVVAGRQALGAANDAETRDFRYPRRRDARSQASRQQPACDPAHGPPHGAPLPASSQRRVPAATPAVHRGCG